MTAYLLRRLLQAVVVVIGVVLIVFVLSQMIPGGMARATLGPRASTQAIDAFDRLNGLTKPVLVQFWHYLAGLPRLRLGYSYRLNQPVWNAIETHLWKSAFLVVVSVAVSLLIAVPLAVYQVVKKHSLGDHLATGTAFVLYATPTFFLATVLIVWFSFDLHLLPVAMPMAAAPWAIFTDPLPFILPVVTLALTSVAGFSRYLRSSLLDALAEDYVRTATAKGASRRRVLFRHALRNALIPVVTLIGLSLPAVVSGDLVIEFIFNYPGIGLLAVQAAVNDDIPLVLGTTLVITIATVAGTLFADLLYLAVDPRIRYVGLAPR